MGNILGIGEPTLIIGLGLNASFSCGQFLILLLLNIGCFAKLVEFSSLYGKNPQAGQLSYNTWTIINFLIAWAHILDHKVI